MKVVTVRIDDKDFEELQKIEKEEQVDRAEVIRKLLTRAIKEWKVKKVIEMVRERKITFRKAAALSGATYSEMLNLLARFNVDNGYSLEELMLDSTS